MKVAVVEYLNQINPANYSAPAKGRGPSLKSGSVSFFFLACIANRHFCEGSQFINLETLIGSRALYSVHVLSLAKYISFCLSGRSVSPHVDSDKLRNELQS